MEFIIINNPSYADSIDVGLELTPDDEVLRLFLVAIGKRHILEFLTSMSDSKGFVLENASLAFFNELDWEDIEGLDYLGGIREGQICIYLYDGVQNETIIDELLFKKIFKEYLNEFLNRYSDELDGFVIDQIRETHNKIL